MTLTRILLPVLIAISALLIGSLALPIFLRELFYRTRRTREIDEWLEDVR